MHGCLQTVAGCQKVKWCHGVVLHMYSMSSLHHKCTRPSPFFSHAVKIILRRPGYKDTFYIVFVHAHVYIVFDSVFTYMCIMYCTSQTYM